MAKSKLDPVQIGGGLLLGGLLGYMLGKRPVTAAGAMAPVLPGRGTSLLRAPQLVPVQSAYVTAPLQAPIGGATAQAPSSHATGDVVAISVLRTSGYDCATWSRMAPAAKFSWIRSHVVRGAGWSAVQIHNEIVFFWDQPRIQFLNTPFVPLTGINARAQMSDDAGTRLVVAYVDQYCARMLGVASQLVQAVNSVYGTYVPPAA